MKLRTYQEFVEEAYASSTIDENIAAKLTSKAGSRAIKAIPLLGRAYSAGEAVYRASQGDWAGAGLSALGAVPGPVGYAALAADIARDYEKKDDDQDPNPQQGKTPTPQQGKTPTPQQNDSSAQQSSESKPQSSNTVLARKGGVEGSLDKSTGKFTASKWTSSQSDRYTKYGGSKTPTSSPTPTPTPTPSVSSQRGRVTGSNPNVSKPTPTPTPSVSSQRGRVTGSNPNVSKPTPTPTPTSSQNNSILNRMKSKRSTATATSSNL
jgi:hypothetical protein